MLETKFRIQNNLSAAFPVGGRSLKLYEEVYLQPKLSNRIV